MLNPQMLNITLEHASHKSVSIPLLYKILYHESCQLPVVLTRTG